MTVLPCLSGVLLNWPCLSGVVTSWCSLSPGVHVQRLHSNGWSVGVWHVYAVILHVYIVAIYLYLVGEYLTPWGISC